ncbi:peptide deformylase [Shewanella intestini]|uniref:Peptide deformylase n=1 Tax=Shewanella intestini TaxID=2017544 RepID=A0ABS5I5T0_9GAMM|nr:MULTISPECIES: peptide deformylase [Shewanella]MBR9729376.1 peptide deformylase [Shewanella intestini]MRG37455.1 peptide deformylase [Shewanella sp. XMDDZSB0408]
MALALTLPIATTGEPILTRVAKPVTEFNQQLVQLTQQMLSTLLAAKGVGIAAPQVHSNMAVFIMASHPNERYPDAPKMDPIVVINPSIIEQSSQQVIGEEGCLSIPNTRINIARADQITVKYQTRYGQWQQQTLRGFVARIFLHEYDHLQGITLLEREQINALTQATIKDRK